MPSVELVFDRNCPNVEEARAQLRRALGDAGSSDGWREWRIGDEGSPPHTRGYGSPTILVDGQDVATEAPCGTEACCRLYAREDGALRGTPTARQILEALNRAPDHNQAASSSYSPVDSREQPTLDPESDEALMAAYQIGDARAFETLFGRYQDRIYGYFVRRFGDREMAADLFQRTFLRVHRARSDFDTSRPFSTWVFGIAANLGKDEYKRRARRPGDVRWDLPAPHNERQTDDNPESAVLARERSTTIEVALARLPDSQREVIILHKIEDLSFPEIADALGEKVEAVKSRAFRGYRALRRLLSDTTEIGDTP